VPLEVSKVEGFHSKCFLSAAHSGNRWVNLVGRGAGFAGGGGGGGAPSIIGVPLSLVI